jgi:hypothetical protein
MMKRIFFRSITAGILSSIASLVYNRIYFFALETDFSKLINTGSLVGANLLGCLLAGTGYWLLRSWLKKRGELVFNFAFSILSFASILIPLSIDLPVDLKHPEYFLGLVVPMQFFPAMAWFTIGPIFSEKPDPE